MTISGQEWQVPKHDVHEFAPRRTSYCVCIPVINEGEKIRKQLARMAHLSSLADIIIADGGSSDGSTDPDYLRSHGVRTLLVKRDSGKLSAQMRMGFAYAVREGYDGVITIDGNNKDSVESIPQFLGELEAGYDFVQGSRYVPGGQGINTPLLRHLAIRLIHAPVISLLSGFPYTDTTSNFRAHSRALLLDRRLSIFRDVFSTYELLAYLSVKAPRFGYRTKEIPVTRTYPPSGKVPTKISPIRGNLLLLKILLNLALGRYDPVGGR